MPPECYYHKHVMYNAGIVFSRGDVVAFADSDAMVRPVFIETILKAFETDPLIVYHMDEFRNVRRDFYPFNYPSFEDVLGEGCINRIGDRTKGIVDELDPMHTRNYGACMCAARNDVIAIGGADESLTYLGHICGPYDMTFRLMNYGRRLVWETEEYLYHTWHPGSDGYDNYLGPHDGRNMSTTAFQMLCSGRIPPRVENAAIRRLRTASPVNGVATTLHDLIIDPTHAAQFKGRKPTLFSPHNNTRPPDLYASYRGFDVYHIEGSFYGFPVTSRLTPQSDGWRDSELVIRTGRFNEFRDIIDRREPLFLETIGSCNIVSVDGRYAIAPQSLGHVDFWQRSHRENPAIEWTDSLEDAANAARRLSAVMPLNDPQPAIQAPGPASPDVASVLSDVDDLERRMLMLESSVSGIYQSRTWKALVGAGAIFQKAAGIVRPRGRENAS
jgi:hypothetical protein